MNGRILKETVNILIQLANILIHLTIRMSKINRDLGDPSVVIAESTHFTFVSQQCMEQFQYMSLRMVYQKYRGR